MTEHVHPGPHPDLESLNAFVEGVLPDSERERCLLHFAECSRCREIVFLAQPPLPSLVSSDAAPAWRHWFAPVPVLGGALAVCACLLLVAVSLYRHETRLQTPASAVRTMPSGVAGEGAENVAGDVAERIAKEESAGGRAMMSPSDRAMKKVPRTTNAQQSPHTPGVIVGAPGTLAQGRVPPLPAPTPLQQPVARASPLQPLLPANRAVVSGAQFSAPSDSVAGGSLKLTVVHGRDTLSGLSEVKGSVTDASGAAVPGAKVTIRPIAGTTSGTTVTDPNGQFAMARLPAGRYDLEIESQGFQKISKQLELHPQDIAMVESKLSVASAAETVQVSAATTALNGVPPGAAAPEITVQPLPSNLPVTSESGRRNIVLAADSAGALFLSRDWGGQWEAIPPPWTGKVTMVGVPADPKALHALTAKGRSAIRRSEGLFEIVTDTGSVWFSADGLHWYPAAPQASTPQRKN